MITRWRYCLNAVMITRLQYCLSASMITRWQYCISVEMVTGWVHWIMNVSNCKELVDCNKGVDPDKKVGGGGRIGV